MKTRKINTKVFAFNVKLRSNERSGSEAYIALFEKMFSEKIIGTPKRGNSMILRTQFKTVIDGNTIIYGKLARFTKLDSDEWINLDSLEKSQYELPANLFPNLKETDYVFVPQAHRFCIRKISNGMSVYQVEEFLKDSLAKCRTSTEQVEVHVEQSISSIEKILNAQAVRRIDLEISYTDNDIGDEASSYVDEILKEMNANKMKMTVSPDQTNTLSIENKFLRGAVELAKSNGTVIASIINNESKNERVITKEHPEEIPIHADNEEKFNSAVFQKIMSIFRP